VPDRVAISGARRTTADKVRIGVDLRTHGQSVHDKPVLKLTVQVRFPSSAPMMKTQVGSDLRTLGLQCFPRVASGRAISEPLARAGRMPAESTVAMTAGEPVRTRCGVMTHQSVVMIG
jgi:hypothetical protein